MTYDAVLFASFGGPESLEEVMPFLERVTAGRGIPRDRLEEVSHHYLTLGGVSPINAQNRQLLAALRTELLLQGIKIPVYWGNRNSEPFFADALREIHEGGHRRVLAFVTSAYSSYSGCRQYRENLAGALQEAELTGLLTIDKVRQYFDHPGFILPFRDGLVQALKTLSDEGIDCAQTEIFFTTHSIPLSMAETSGPADVRATLSDGTYVAQHRATAQCVIDQARTLWKGEIPRWSLVYQSRSGAPQTPWLEPDIRDALRARLNSATSAVIVIPIGFVSDHIEVIWDLDNEASQTADEVGLRLIRVATPGASHDFVSGIVDLLQERLDSGESKALSVLGPWRDVCAQDCCPNARGNLPAVAQSAESQRN
jgi:ferrochelatase